MAVTSSAIYNSVASSISGSGIHHDVTYKVSDVTADVFKTLVSFDPAGDNVSELSKFSSLCVINVGSQPIEALLEIMQFSSGAKGGSNPNRFITMILNPSQLFYIPTSKVIEHNSSGNKISASDIAGTGGSGNLADFIKAYSGSTTRGDSKTNTAAGVVASGALLNAGSGIAADDVAMNIDISGGGSTATNFFKVNDLIKMGSEVMLITEITSLTAMSIERGLLGTTAATHSNNTVINHYYLNESKDIGVYTNRSGFYSATSFFAYGRNSVYPMGITPGSVAIKFYEPAYQEFGMSNQSSATESGLTASTAYAFDITPDNMGSATTVSFTTDSSNTKWGGNNGVLQKINDSLKAKFDDNTFKYLPFVTLAGGDIRFTSGSRISGTTANYGSSIVLAAASSGTSIFGVNRIPAIGAIYETVQVQVPANDNTSKIMFDDGLGQLRSSEASGRIDYETGAVTLNGPSNAEFEVSCYFNSALSGDIAGGISGSNRDNHVIGVYARSMNPFREGKARVIAIDDGVDDTTLKSKIKGINR